MVTTMSKMSFAVAMVVDPTGSYLEEMIRIKEKVHELIDYAVRLDTTDACEVFIRSVRYEHIVLIVTPDIIDEIFEKNLYLIRHVQSIFLYDPNELMDSDCFYQLRQSSYKVQDTSSKPDDLYQCLWEWIQEFAGGSDILLSTLSMCPSNAMTTNVINNIADFAEFWYPLYIDFLLELPILDSTSERRRFIEQCRIHFARNPGRLKQINDFEANYRPEKALFYYSCDSFVYHLINRALRQQTIDGTIDFRFILVDIHNQLQDEFKTFITATCAEDFFEVFFRGQRMTHEELNELKKKHRAGTLITTNSYFSTSMKRSIARIFAGETTMEYVSVLFEVTTHIKNVEKTQRKPFAYIGTCSQFGDQELEVLFSIGSFFKINSIFYDDSDSVWIIQISFIEDYDTNLEVTKDYCTLQTCSLEAMIVKIGTLLADHPRQGIPVAKAFYKMIMEWNFSENLTLACNIGLGWLALKEKNLALAIELQHVALDNHQRLLESESTNLTHLRAMCYNCIGTAYRLKHEYKQALHYFLKAQELAVKVPIDKYAMYNGYRNITAVNIASIHKLMSNVDRAWDTFKIMLAHETDACIRFHARTYLTIAQAGLHEAQINHDADEYERCSQSWKNFLDISLTSMSSSYRRSIISGVLLWGFEYANNEQTRTMAIDYFHKVINISKKYVNKNREDRLIVLQCQNQVSRLYTKKQNYDQATNHAMDALQMCNENDIADIAECYESMIQIYEQRLLNERNDLTPEDISRLIIGDNPFASMYNNTSTVPSTTAMFDRSEFVFGQFSVNKINPIMLRDDDPKHQLVYCLLKAAALTQLQGYKEEEQAKVDHDDSLNKQARVRAIKVHQLLHKASELLQDNPSIQRICINNFAYLEGNFDSIIAYYLQDLNDQKENKTTCIGEDAFCYLAHLYGRQSNIIEEHHWYERGVKHFQEGGYICEHTVECFHKLAHFNENHDTLGSSIDVYQNLVCYLLKYKLPCFLHTSIALIVMKLVQYFHERDHIKQAITILQQLIQLITTESIDGEVQIDEQFKKIIKICNNEHVPISQAYTTYLEVILKYQSSSPDFHICAIEPVFHQAISVYQTHGYYPQVIRACERFVQLLLDVKTNRSTVEAAFKELALDLEKSLLFQIALSIYTDLGNFIIKYQDKDDFIMAGFVISRCKFLKQKDIIVNSDTQQMLINLMTFYHNVVCPQFIVDDYLETIKQNYEPHSTTGIYMSLLAFCFKNRSEHYTRYMRTNVAALSNRPEELIAFIASKRVNYKLLLGALLERYGKGTIMICTPEQPIADFEANANKWFWTKEDTDDSYWSQLLRCLFEWQSKDDEYMASCYLKINDVESAASIFDTQLYGDPALKYSSNACRRYLQCVYPQVSCEQRINLEQHYQDHFLIVSDSFSDSLSHEILSPE